MDREPTDLPEILNERLDRRSLLKRGAVIAGSATVVPKMLVAYGSGSRPGASQAKAPWFGTPSKGGTLRIGTQGNGLSETFNPAFINSPIDFLHAYSVFDPMVRMAPNHQTEPGLVLEWNPNKTYDVYELKLRKGVTWHDGKPFTADDLIYTFHSLLNPNNFGHPAVVGMRVKDIKKLNAHLVRVPLERPNNDLAALFGYGNMTMVIQNGAKDFKHPIGTGPFRFESFSVGKRATLTANRHYWDHPYPYPDGLEIISIDDENARVGALQAGVVDIAWPFPAAQAKPLIDNPTGRYGVKVGPPGLAQSFFARVDLPPFNDPRVLEAMKLILDRPALIEAALSGYGAVANDICGAGLKYYDDSIPQRPHDPDKAKSLLKAAGHADLHVTLTTTPIFAGEVQAATAFVQQAKQAGVTVDVKKALPSAYFDPAQLFLKMAFGQTAWPVNSLQFFYSSAMLKTASLNETHFHSKSFDQLYADALAAPPDKAQDLWNQVQRITYDKGGEWFWVNQKVLLGVSNKVRGLNPQSGWMYELDDFNTWKWGLA